MQQTKYVDGSEETEIFELPAGAAGEAELARRVAFALRNPRVKSTAFAPLDKVGRNDPCPCNSGKKFKKCCINRTGPRVGPIHHPPRKPQAS